MVPHARLLATCLLILLCVSPVTAPFATGESDGLENTGAYPSGFVVRADTSPDESLVLPAIITQSSSLFAVVVFDSFSPAVRPSLNRPTQIVLRV